jgi:Zn-dependent protease with chaperone function
VRQKGIEVLQTTIGGIVGSVTLGFGNLISTGLQAAILNWKRKSEYTADRAGLLACQNFNSAVTAMTKIAGYPSRHYAQIDPQDFLLQAKEFEGYDEDAFDKAAKFLSVLFADHPWAVMRGAEMNNWIESGAYSLLMNKHDGDIAAEGRMRCENCGKSNEEASIFCSRCGAKLK